jgi:hypothetical protein
VSGRTVVAVALSLSLVAAVAKLPKDRTVASVSRLSQTQRERAPLAAVDLDPALVEAARRLLPRDTVYAVVTGAGVPGSQPLTLDAVRPLTAFWLLPRRQLQYPKRAEWVLSFGGDLGALGLRYTRVVHVAEGVDIAEVRR